MLKQQVIAIWKSQGPFMIWSVRRYIVGNGIIGSLANVGLGLEAVQEYDVENETNLGCGELIAQMEN